MELSRTARLLRVHVGETDKVNHVPLYEVIIREARKAGMAGATASRGIMGFGPSSRVRSAKVLDLSADLPVVIELVDEAEKIEAFAITLDSLFEQANSGGLVTMENVEVRRYAHGKKPG